jgi:hypothetical protein
MIPASEYDLLHFADGVLFHAKTIRRIEREFGDMLRRSALLLRAARGLETLAETTTNQLN